MMKFPTNYMARLGGRLIENGYPILPIMPGTKKPGRFTCGAWCDYPGWTRHCYRQSTEIELGIWSQWPSSGIGIACGAVVGVDIDELDGEQAYQLEQRARTMLGDTPAVRFGLSPKRLLLYRTAEPFCSIGEPLEVLCAGRQFVAFSDHPDTGQPYQWPDASPADLSVFELPTVDLAKVYAFLGQRQRSSDNSHVPGNGELSGTIEAIADALRFIPNADVVYGTWIRIGMAIRGALGADGWPLFAAWSATSSKDVPATTEDAWSSVQAGAHRRRHDLSRSTLGWLGTSANDRTQPQCRHAPSTGIAR